MTVQVVRYHDFCAGHRVHGHEGKCANLHGHNYRAYFHLEPISGMDEVGRVLDFSVIKDRLCQWLETNWDHRMLLGGADPLAEELVNMDDTVCLVPFNPTAENMALYLLHVVGPAELCDLRVRLVRVDLWETRKCMASVNLGKYGIRWTEEGYVPDEVTR